MRHEISLVGGTVPAKPACEGWACGTLRRITGGGRGSLTLKNATTGKSALGGCSHRANSWRLRDRAGTVDQSWAMRLVDVIGIRSWSRKDAAPSCTRHDGGVGWERAWACGRGVLTGALWGRRGPIQSHRARRTLPPSHPAPGGRTRAARRTCWRRRGVGLRPPLPAPGLIRGSAPW